MLSTTAAASRAEPSWNLTPGRILNVHWVTSLLEDQDVASDGTSLCVISSVCVSAS